MIKHTITKDDAGRTLLKFIQRVYKHLPLSRIERALREKDIKVNNVHVRDKTYLLKENDELVMYNLDLQKRETPFLATKMTFNVIFEDKNILVVEKPQGLTMHGDKNSLDAQVLRYLNFEKNSSFVPASIGRLDKITSGLVIYGKTYDAVRILNNAQNGFRKVYQFKSDIEKSQLCTLNLMHDENSQKEIVVARGGKEAITKFTINDKVKLAELVTGRKHQIRVSLSHLGFPIYGDVKYGGKRASRVFLHSYKLSLDELVDDLAYLNGKEFVSDPG